MSAVRPPELTARRPERSEDASPPIFLLSRSRKLCASCQIRKTYWLVSYGDVSSMPTSKGGKMLMHGYRNRRCWACMTDAERAVFREGY